MCIESLFLIPYIIGLLLINTFLFFFVKNIFSYYLFLVRFNNFSNLFLKQFNININRIPFFWYLFLGRKEKKKIINFAFLSPKTVKDILLIGNIQKQIAMNKKNEWFFNLLISQYLP